MLEMMGLHVLGKEATNSRVVEMNERVEKLICVTEATMS